MAMTVGFEGVYPILATPFDEGENLDLESFGRMVRFMADVGADGVTIIGVLGESGRMVDIERVRLIKAAVAAADGRIPVIVGTSHEGTHATRYLSQMAESLGAGGSCDAVAGAGAQRGSRLRILPAGRRGALHTDGRTGSSRFHRSPHVRRAAAPDREGDPRGRLHQGGGAPHAGEDRRVDPGNDGP
jgi:hypothetical protein